jgi:hypothetical protein
MNIMYFGIPNPIDVSVPGVSPADISIKVVNGTFSTEKVKNPDGVPFKGGWAVSPTAVGQKVQVIVTAKMNGKPVTMPPYEFRVKKIPPPIAVFADRSQGSIPKNVAAAQSIVLAKLIDFDFDLRYDITEFKLFYNDKGSDYSEASTSTNLTQKQKILIGAMSRGKTLIIKDIKAKGPDGRLNDLPPILLTIE